MDEESREARSASRMAKMIRLVTWLLVAGAAAIAFWMVKVTRF